MRDALARLCQICDAEWNARLNLHHDFPGGVLRIVIDNDDFESEAPVGSLLAEFLQQSAQKSGSLVRTNTDTDVHRICSVSLPPKQVLLQCSRIKTFAGGERFGKPKQLFLNDLRVRKEFSEFIVGKISYGASPLERVRI
jgi:hypothetical protein